MLSVDEVFARTLAFVSRREAALSGTTLAPCANVRRGLKSTARRRAFMHTNHRPGVICADGAISALPLNHLVGVLLHEFGHLAAGESEAAADQWPLARLGIPITYKGPLCLEWVSGNDLRMILGDH